MLGSVRMFCIRYTYEVLSCQVTVSHLPTLTEDSAHPGSLSSTIVVQRLEQICIMEESTRIDSIKAETDVSIHNEKNVTGHGN